MKTALDKIIDYKRDEVSKLKQERSLSEFETLAQDASPTRGFIESLNNKVSNNENALICELKRKSPSAGDILPGADPIQIAGEYEAGGAACLSVLTDFPSFGGTLDDMVTARNLVSIPVLRKDFMIDPIQIAEARAYGADCILLILSALDDGLTGELASVATSLGLDILVEVHDSEELDRALKMDLPLIGVNNRDLKRMVTDLSVSVDLANRVKNHKMVSESGVKTVDDIKQLQTAGYRRFLIGESLMKETDRESAVKSLVKATIY